MIPDYIYILIFHSATDYLVLLNNSLYYGYKVSSYSERGLQSMTTNWFEHWQENQIN